MSETISHLADGFLSLSLTLTLGMLSLAFLMVVVRIMRGPTLPDRIIGLDLLVGIAMGFIAAMGILSGIYLYLDIAIALGLVGFLATVAFARFVIRRGQMGDAAVKAQAPRTAGKTEQT
ncbi:Na(+)/H(+) antiporter subunit F [Hartmannibacter diazotrophicus]|uniref:Na(+)/H(+) antiporter subunit F n=1 Tax=Hartmannibacter diazotrophicus TaxID=1482074 RepID=A0A2C9D3X2_9HYPH|nr:cation:proton antiporter [Hartmannibacter diazotrophicus]SON54858.1 Na(+)/H(+) antiporter subunit F [Hartmannibacter diazotrophicus]